MPLETNNITRQTISLNTMATNQYWTKTFDSKYISFPPGKDPEDITKVRAKLPHKLSYLEGFFSKKAAAILPPSQPGFDITLELEKPLTGKLV